MTLATDQTLSCPHCGNPIKLNESLAASLVAATRAEYERRLAAQTEAVAIEKLALASQQLVNDRRAAELAAAAEKQQEEVAQAVQRQVREQVQQQLTRDRKVIADEESARARQQVDDELETQKANLDQQTQRIVTLTQKLATAQAAEANLLRKEQELQDKEREFALNLQKGIAGGLEQARAQALREAQASLDQKVQDRENTIIQLRDQITSLQRRAQQGSQQGAGARHVLRHGLRDDHGKLGVRVALVLLKFWEPSIGPRSPSRTNCTASFLLTLIEPVAKGEFGGDVLQHALRISLIELSTLRRSNDGMTAKSQQIYTYLTGLASNTVSNALPKNSPRYVKISTPSESG